MTVTDCNVFVPIETPPAVPPRQGLLVTSPPIEDGANWRPGFQWKPAPGGDPESISSVRDPFNSGQDDKLPDDSLPVQTYAPFAVVAFEECSTMTFGDLDDTNNPIRTRALSALLAAQGWQIEREMWTGTQAAAAGYPQVPVDSSAGLTVVEGTASPIALAVALLDGAAAESMAGRRRMILMSSAAIDAAAAAFAVFPQPGNRWATAAGTEVVAGEGFPGTGPDGAAPSAGAAWIYAVPWVSTRLSTPTVIPFLDPRTNTRWVLAERLAAAYFDDVRLAAQADLG